MRGHMEPSSAGGPGTVRLMAMLCSLSVCECSRSPRMRAVTANWWIRNGECAYCFYIPEARLRNGNANFPKGQVVTIDLPLMANKDATYAASLIVGKIPGCPALPARS